MITNSCVCNTGRGSFVLLLHTPDKNLAELEVEVKVQCAHSNQVNPVLIAL